MKQMLVPWGAGSRVCLGQSLATMELRRSIVMFLLKTDGRVTLSPSCTEDSMKPVIFFLARPKADMIEVIIG